MKPDFDLNVVLALVEEAIEPYPKAAMFDLAKRGYNSLFEQLIACIISIRTLDEITIPVSLRLFEVARTPDQIFALDLATLTTLLNGTTYPDQKATHIWGIASRIVNELGKELPADFETLISFKGVGPKCANLALGVAVGKAAISVDVHVHRVVNRWGFVQTRQPEQTLEVLKTKVPQNQWIAINRLLMPFGKHICTGTLPHCSTCPVLDWCNQVGVERHR